MCFIPASVNPGQAATIDFSQGLILPGNANPFAGTPLFEALKSTYPMGVDGGAVMGDRGSSQGQYAAQQFGAGLIPQIDQYIQNQYAQGNILNPNVKITQQTLVQFLSQAENEVNSGFRSTLRVAKEGFMRQLGYSSDEISRQEQEAEQKYGQQLRTLGEQSAEAGFAQSGIRGERERLLAESTQRAIEDRRREIGFEAGSLARTYAGRFGGLFG